MVHLTIFLQTSTCRAKVIRSCQESRLIKKKDTLHYEKNVL